MLVSVILSLLIVLQALCLAPAVVSADEDTRSGALPLLDSLFQGRALDTAWEVHPLLSRIKEEDQCSGKDPIPSIHLSDPALQKARLEQVTKLFKTENLKSVLEQDVELGIKMLKKVFDEDGNEDYEEFEEDEIGESDFVFEEFEKHGFSVVFDRLQEHWGDVARWTREFERESWLSHVSCNLYLTPAGNSAFGTHMDWMDVIVLQLEGKKNWQVAKKPTVYLPSEDLQRDPTEEEEKETEFYDQFVLNVGDALYIPRGYLHNASTFDDSASLHLTFGFEPNEGTVEYWVGMACEDDDIDEIIGDVTQENDTYNVLRQAVSLNPAWKDFRNMTQQFVDAVELVASELSEHEDYGPKHAEAFRKETLANMDIGLGRFRQAIMESQADRWEEADEFMKSAGQEINEEAW